MSRIGDPRYQQPSKPTEDELRILNIPVELPEEFSIHKTENNKIVLQYICHGISVPIAEFCNIQVLNYFVRAIRNEPKS